MIEIVALIIFLIGLIGVSVIIIRKIPILNTLPPREIKQSSFKRIKERIRTNGTLNNFSKDRLMHKGLSKFKVLTLKTERKTSDLLTKLRQKSIESKDKFSEDYWSKVRRKR